MNIRGKVFVVTGGGNGIGRALVLELLSRGARVAAVDMSQLGLSNTVEIAGGQAEFLSAHIVDITEKAAVYSLPDSVMAAHGTVDGVINCAGIIQGFEKFEKTGIEEIQRVVNTNLYGTVFMIKAFFPHLKCRPEACIMNISSMGGLFPVLGQTVYGFSKAAVKLLTEGLYQELQGTNIHVSVVFPGGVNSNIMKNSGVAVNKKLEKLQGMIKITMPGKAARVIIDGIERNRSRIFVGMDVKAMNLLYKLSPQGAPRIISSILRRLFPEY